MEKYNLSNEEWEYLTFAPFDIAIGVAGSDGHIAREELNPLANFISQSSFLKDSLSKDIFGEIYDSGQEAWKAHRERSSKSSLKDNLQNVGRILDKLEESISEPYIENLLRLGMSTAFSYGDPNRPMSDQEINQIGHMFRWMNKDFEKYFNKISQKIKNNDIDSEDDNHRGQYL